MEAGETQPDLLEAHRANEEVVRGALSPQSERDYRQAVALTARYVRRMWAVPATGVMNDSCPSPHLTW